MKIALIGYGKMGKAVETYALSRGHQVTLKINLENKELLTHANLSRCDVAIEFTSPHTAVANIKTCFDAGIPVICGSTGWYEQLENVRQLCLEKNAALLYASNFSIGVNLFFALNKFLAGLMNTQVDYNVMIEEIHHLQKLDKPSGTAITLANDILKSISRKQQWKLADESALPVDLAITAKREPDVVGIHSVNYTSSVDEIHIQHKAFNRSGFARGAVHAAEWIINKKGCYEMRDMLNL